jgi:hypothetical protein
MATFFWLPDVYTATVCGGNGALAEMRNTGNESRQVMKFGCKHRYRTYFASAFWRRAEMMLLCGGRAKRRPKDTFSQFSQHKDACEFSSPHEPRNIVAAGAIDR